MRSKKQLVGLGVVALLLAPGMLVGCSSGGGKDGKPSAKKIWDSSVEASKAASSGHLVGTFNDGTTPAFSMDIAGTLDGKNQKFIMKDPKGTNEILTVENVEFVKSSAAGGGKYIKTPIDPAKDRSDTSIKSFLEQSMGAVKFNVLDDLATKVEEIDHHGALAYKLTDSKSKASVIVKKDGYFLLSLDDGEGKSKIDISEWNAVKPWVAPPADQILG